jgi:hypothetical protein
MSYKLTGKISSISEKQTFDSGAAKITFRVDTEDQYNDDYEFELYKGDKYLEHLDNFLKFNKVGDNVEVEFNLKSKLWTNPKTNEQRTFTSLSCWKIEKLEGSQPTSAPEPQLETSSDDNLDLPF